eukprot:658354-Prymnesium_polylepis.2
MCRIHTLLHSLACVICQSGMVHDMLTHSLLCTKQLCHASGHVILQNCAASHAFCGLDHLSVLSSELAHHQLRLVEQLLGDQKRKLGVCKSYRLVTAQGTGCSSVGWGRRVRLGDG